MLTHPLIASEAIHAVDVPVIKAWDRDENGNIRAFQRITISPDDEFGIHVQRENGDRTVLPLFITAKYVAETFGRIMNVDNVYPERSRISDYEKLVQDALDSGNIDKRLCPEARNAIQNGIAERANGVVHHYTDDIITHIVAEAEYSSLCKRIMVKAMGYSRGPTGIAKMLNSVIWQDVLQHDIACACTLLKGRSADTGDYQQVARIWEPSEFTPYGLKSFLQTHRPAVIHSMEGHHQIAEDLIDRIGAFPAKLRAGDLKPAVWRMLLKMSVPQNVAIKPLISGATGESYDASNLFFDNEDVYRGKSFSEICASILNRLAELGAHDCPATVLRVISRMPRHQMNSTGNLLLPILTRARWARRRGLVKETARLVPLIADAWTSYIENGLPHASGEGATWESIIRAQEDWHREQVAAKAVEDVQWPPLLPEFSTKVASARELTNSRELFDEGQLMDHCVGGYSHYCVTGRSRIFSIARADGKARSTLQVTLQPSGIWRVSQHYGYNNQMIDKSLKAWEKTLLRAINRAQQKSAPDMKLAA